MVTHSSSPHRTPTTTSRTAGRRTLWAWAASVFVPLLLAAAMLPVRGGFNLPTVLLIFLLGVQMTALIGGVLPAVVSAVIASVLANLLFTRPFGSLTIAQPQNAFALIVFVAVGVTVASIVDRSRASALEAARGQAEAQMLAAVAGSMAAPGDPLVAILEQARVGFGMEAAALLSTSPQAPAAVTVLASVGTPHESVEPATVVEAAGPKDPEADTLQLALYGHPLAATDQRLAEVIAAQAAVALDRNRLTTKAGQAERLQQTDLVRTAILAAVSHDLRTPLATIKASLSSLRDRSVAWSESDRADLLATADGAADQLDSLLSNLLDLSRLQTGVLTAMRRAVSVDEVVYRALIGLPSSRVDVDIADDLPLVDTDRGLLERVVANILSNAVQHSPPGVPVQLLAGEVRAAGRRTLQIRVVDHGPGIAMADRDAMFAPFQRLGDAPGGSGVGLGLAVARGLAEAVGATIDVEDTPGGGLTMVIDVPIAEPLRRARTAGAAPGSQRN